MKLQVNEKHLNHEVSQELGYFKTHEGSSFKGVLYHLISKADRANLHKLALGFPLEVVAWFYFMDDMKRLESFGYEIELTGGNDNE
ncbi:hypothetical protein [Bacillus paramobilis]|uniref:hypothetical protein n=1 Tax=Bacillus paramobilis TaxID=2817477 RepID=UPI001BB391BF|nr:hypothetical protein [Bacillus paramobilis]HEF5065767.1 hypothetical protein [Bacillus cereus]HEF5237751.1 hypothetical protein [Bacillus cereus]